MKKKTATKKKKGTRTKREVRDYPFIDSFNCAIEGLIYIVKTQRNMRIHFILAIFVLIAALLLQLDGTDFILVCLAILMVLFSEAINTAIELHVDLVSEKYHPVAKNVKDICAGAVLLSCGFAILVGYLILAKKFDEPIRATIHGIHASPWNISLACLGIVVVASILLKILLHRGTPFYGGMPSAHSGIAFSIWMLVTLMSMSTLISALAFVSALLIAQSRIALKAHTLWEVTAGALLGSFVTLTLFQIFN